MRRFDSLTLQRFIGSLRQRRRGAKDLQRKIISIVSDPFEPAEEEIVDCLRTSQAEIFARSHPNGTYLSLQLSLHQASNGRIIGESFRECLDGYAACGLLRKNFHRLSGHKIYLAFIFWIFSINYIFELK